MSGHSSNLPLRPCVVAVFRNHEKKLLVCERSDVQGAWQFPQGGIEAGESAEVALFREMNEELGDNQFKIILKGKNPISYLFPSDMGTKIAQKYSGQIQDWFLVEFNAGHGPNLKHADGEFKDIKWETPAKILSEVIEWKRKAYESGFQALGIKV